MNVYDEMVAKTTEHKAQFKTIRDSGGWCRVTCQCGWEEMQANKGLGRAVHAAHLVLADRIEEEASK